MQFLTDFGDQAVTLPSAVVLGLVLWASGWARAARAWAAAGAACWLALLALKLAFAACGPAPGDGALADPSGHTGSAAFVYGGMLALLLPRRPWAPAAWPAVPVAAAMGASRALLGVHSWADAALGGLVGVACAHLLVRLAGPRPPGLPSPASWAWAALLTVSVAMHGARLTAEAGIRAFAGWTLAPACAADPPGAGAPRRTATLPP